MLCTQMIELIFAMLIDTCFAQANWVCTCKFQQSYVEGTVKKNKNKGPLVNNQVYANRSYVFKPS